MTQAQRPRRAAARPRLMRSCRVGIENHCLLADLYFAVLETASAFVDVQHGTGGGHLRVDKPEAARDRAFAE
jgi:hypothetical protein